MRREINVTLITGAFIFIWKREGLVSRDWHSTTPHISLQVLLGTHLCVAFAETTLFLEWRTSLKVKESEKSRGAVERHADPQSWRSGTVRGMFSCEERER